MSHNRNLEIYDPDSSCYTNFKKGRILLYCPSYLVGENGKNVLNDDTINNIKGLLNLIIVYKNRGYDPLDFSIAFVGGKFLNERYQDIAISLLMLKFFYELIEKHGLKEYLKNTIIYTELKSVDSWENIDFLIKDYNLKNYYFDQIIIISHWCHWRHYYIMTKGYGFKKNTVYKPDLNYKFININDKIDITRYLKEFISNLLAIMDPKGSWCPIILKERRKRRNSNPGNFSFDVEE